MWTDPHISRQLLEVHLNEHIDLASRKPETIERTIDWILSRAGEGPLQILDLGCGPGLYSQRLAQKGHKVTGVDFSKNSIEYAKQQAWEESLDITYLNEDYTQLDLPENSFDLVMLVFTDFGPLSPEAREKLLGVVKKVLKPGGRFIFDVLNDSDIPAKLSPKSWEFTDGGFWKDQPYLYLSESFLYEEEKVILYQHMVIDEDDQTQVHRFWTHFFSDEDLGEILAPHGFNDLSFFQDIIPSGDGYKDSDVTFCVAELA
jgi:SAM-dependent methyltransferase